MLEPIVVVLNVVIVLVLDDVGSLVAGFVVAVGSVAVVGIVVVVGIDVGIVVVSGTVVLPDDAVMSEVVGSPMLELTVHAGLGIAQAKNINVVDVRA